LDDTHVYDVVVIGAGCVGACIARELSKTTASVLVVDSADDVTQGATKGNSGIVHTGYDDKPGTLRARFCWPGNQMFPQLDKELNFG
jgi:glycerol-3-phosphate dehydrogenase